MKALVLPGGWDSWRSPVDRSTPAHLVRIANKPLLEYVLETIRNIGVTDIGLVIDDREPQTVGAVGGDVRVIPHHGAPGTLPALAAARDFLDGDDFLLYSGGNLLADGLGAAAAEFRSTRPVAQLLVHKVPDPSAFVVAEVGENGVVLDLRDHPADSGGSNLAVIGAYFFTAEIHAAAAAVSAATSGATEPGVIDVVRWLHGRGVEIGSQEYYGFWRAVESPDALLECNRQMLGELHRDIAGDVDDETELVGPVVVAAGARVVRSRIVGPAIVGADTVVEGSKVGPNTAVGRDCVIHAATLTDSIVFDGASVRATSLRDFVVGRFAWIVPAGDRGTAPIRLEPREDLSLPGRLADSAAAKHGRHLHDTAEVTAWLGGRARAHRYQVERIPITELDGWSTHPETGNLAHRSGKFFTIEGLDVTVDGGSPRSYRHWQQPIIVQPEVGILGILVKEFDGVLHCLLQAKMEPGNPEPLQLSPTVQATHSNYTGVHNGASVPYLEYFLDPGRGKVIADVLQSEHGSWFSRKVNRNMIIEVDEEVPPRADFCWLTLGQVGDLLWQDNVVNMDTRTVLACAPASVAEPGALHSDAEVLSWFTAERSRYDVAARHIPLADVTDWSSDEWAIRHARDWYFQVVAVSVRADRREVARWSQPLIEPIRLGLIAFVLRQIAGVPHLLVHARAEGGFRNGVEMGPTVQLTPQYHELDGSPRSRFLDLVLDAAPERVRYTSVQSEEGGRLLNAENRYLIVEADESQAPLRPPEGYLWVTPSQLGSLLRHGHYVNIQARTLLAAIHTGAVRLYD
ncbi:NDP-hexose 2,3-dehydratase family protein [Actinophytocola glycyrrhizae]|uniref:NDP-hexose 2,3-dehydratase family protein n=1 Tax=Actinophytocola glycyrrhizae TaxID=2044873 RepID=A0ABV9SBQ5_9PSEU